MNKEKSKAEYLKIVFSLISLFLMLPPLMNENDSYFRTLFIFLINRVIDMIFNEKTEENVFFIIWSLLNQWVGVIACAIAFSSIAPDFVDMCKNYSYIINICMFIAAASCVLKDMVVLIIASVKSNLIIKRIKKYMYGMKGESI